MLSWVKEMKWKGSHELLEGEMEVWRVDGLVVGYLPRWEKFSNVVVLNVGHLVPIDHSLNSQVMLQDWVLERGLFAHTQDGARVTHPRRVDLFGVIGRVWILLTSFRSNYPEDFYK